MNIRKAAVLLASILGLFLPLTAEAGVFANITGTVRSMNVQLSTVSFGGLLSRTTTVYKAGKDVGSILGDEPSNTWDFIDSIAFVNAQLDMAGTLLSPAPGTSASGPAEFLFMAPVDHPRNGTQVTIYGATNVNVVLNVGNSKASVRATNFIPSFVLLESFRNNTSVSATSGSARITLPSMPKRTFP